MWEKKIIKKKIEVATKGLSATYSKSLNQLSSKNADTLCDYLSDMKSETNLSDNYRCAAIMTLGSFSRFSKMPFKSITKKHVTLFLDSILKPEDVDPLHKVYWDIQLLFSDTYTILQVAL
jgi:hypothetical protein